MFYSFQNIFVEIKAILVFCKFISNVPSSDTNKQKFYDVIVQSFCCV